MNVAAGQAIRGMHIEPLHCTVAGGVAQTLQRWTYQRTARVALVDEAQLWVHADPVLAHPLFQRGDLATDRTGLSLLVRRNPRIERGPVKRIALRHALIPPTATRDKWVLGWP